MMGESNNKNLKASLSVFERFITLTSSNLDVIILFSCAFVFYLVTSDIKNLWLDEILSVRDIKQNFGAMLKRRLYAGHCPTYFSFMWFWVRIFGEGDALLRFPSLISGLGCAGVLFFLLKKHTDRLTAFVCTMLLLMNVPFINLSQLVRMYTMNAFFVMLSISVLINGEDRDRLRDIILLAITSALALLTHYSAGLFVAGQLAYLLIRRYPKWKLAGGILIGVLCFVPWAIIFFLRGSKHSPLHWLWEPSLHSILSLPTRLAVNEDLTGIPRWLIYVIALFICLFAIRGGLALGRLGRLFIFMWVVPILGALILTFMWEGNIVTIVRYFSLVTIAQAALVAAGLVSGLHRLPKTRCIMITAMAAISTFLIMKYVTVPPPEDWRIVASELKPLTGRKDPVLFIGEKDETIRYYYKGKFKSNHSLKKWKKKNSEISVEKFFLNWAGQRFWLVNSISFMEELQNRNNNESLFNGKLYDIVMKHYRIKKEINIGKVLLRYMEKID